ncbi:MAG: DUF3800 domain-containing protein [Chloroflexi bacterium]|nr:DUF3800 domain-containing protein [Chloroflexota bacterium]
MLVFVDESGDLGFKFDRGSTRYFTIALVVFESGEAAMACQRAIERTKDQLGLPANYEFHFHGDSHERRLALLGAAARQDFSCYTFTLDKASPRLTGRGFKYRDPSYKWVCRIALENMTSDLQNATIIIDGSGERKFRHQIKDYLRRELNSEQRQKIREVRISRSSSDPLVQLADYVAGVTNRLYEGKAGAEHYEVYLRRKRRSQRKWP